MRRRLTSSLWWLFLGEVLVGLAVLLVADRLLTDFVLYVIEDVFLLTIPVPWDRVAEGLTAAIIGWILGWYVGRVTFGRFMQRVQERLFGDQPRGKARAPPPG